MSNQPTTWPQPAGSNYSAWKACTADSITGTHYLTSACSPSCWFNLSYAAPVSGTGIVAFNSSSGVVQLAVAFSSLSSSTGARASLSSAAVTGICVGSLVVGCIVLAEVQTQYDMYRKREREQARLKQQDEAVAQAIAAAILQAHQGLVAAEAAHQRPVVSVAVVAMDSDSVQSTESSPRSMDSYMERQLAQAAARPSFSPRRHSV